MKPHTAAPIPSAVELHREELNQALRLALGTSQPALRKQALDRAATHLVHPGLVLDSPLLTDSHPWRREALAVSDAFEAVTNGMEEPGVLETLEDMESESPFQPWKHLILAIHFFYEGLDEAVQAHLDRIPQKNPLGSLARTIESLIGTRSQVPLPPALRRLAHQLAEPDPLVLQWVQDLSEGLEVNNEELFWNALTDWLEAIAPEAPDLARAAVLWAWNQLEWRDFDEGVLLDLGSSLWGRSESYRLAALGTLPWDPEGASLLWLRFLVTAIREEELSRETLREARGWLERFHGAALDEASGFLEAEETWKGLCRAWNTETALRGWSDLGWSAPVASSDPAPLTMACDGQLDLFA